MNTTLLNPFVVGGAIADPSGQGFFGREKVFEFVRSALNSVYRPPILLIGQRRIGKSSVLRQLPAHLPPNSCCIYFDLQGKERMPLDGLLYGLARAIADGMKMNRPERDQATESAFDQFLDVVFEKLGGDQHRLVFLLDEFDVVDEEPESTTEDAVKRFIPYLAELIARHPRVGFILVVGRKTEELSESMTGMILKDTVRYPIGRLEYLEIHDLILKSSADVLFFSDAAIQKVFDLTSGHPFCTQVLCHVIWSRALKRADGPPFTILPDDVSDSVAEAGELGANGMNWIFDGLTDPTHRLVLAAVGQESEPLLGLAVDRGAIDAALRKRSVFMESVEVDRAVQDLEAWDVLVKSGSGFLFAVPMIGLWIKNRRPLERLQSEVRFANPRAWRFYELGLDSRDRGELDAAVEEFRRALEANPSFAEAQRALASTLFQRRRPEDMRDTIEQLERALEFDPTGPKTELLEALTEGISTTAKVEAIKVRFNRIRELDPGGRYESKALRILKDRARVQAELPGTAQKGVELYELTGSQEDADAARPLAKRQTNVGYGYLVWFFSIVGLYLAGRLHYPNLVPWIRLAIATMGGAGILWATHFELPSGIWRTPLLGAFATVIVCGAGTYFTHRNIPAYLAAFALFVIAAAISPKQKALGPFPEDAAPHDPGSLLNRVRSAVFVLRSGTPRNRGEQKGDR